MRARFVWIAGVVMVTGCVDDHPATPAGPERDAVFLGYSDAGAHQTTCGNCHITKQRTWEVTAHARAWDDLQASGHAGASCYRCHTVNGTSNQAPDSAGFFAVSDASKPLYHDVQCESCHGPGAVHVAAPDDAQPLTTIAADTAATVGCGTCHSGVHTPFVEEWKQSGHGFVESHAEPQAACQGCHDGRAALARFDPDAHFIEQDSTKWSPITCAVCHDPHGGSTNPAQLRRPINTASLETNLCMQCHYRRSVPDPTTSRMSPHSPEGPMLLGEAGWRPSTFTYDSLQGASSHGSDANPRLCAGCHVHAFSVTDNLTGVPVFTTGHRFRPIPCLTSGGAPDTTDTCALAARSFGACTASGCHATESAARNAFTAVNARMDNYVRTLWIDVNGNGNLDAFPTDSGLLAKVKQSAPGDFAVNPTITVGEGALFNANLLKLPGSGVHNPFYAEALAIATIDEVRSKYGLPAPPVFERLMRSRAALLRMNPLRGSP